MNSSNKSVSVEQILQSPLAQLPPDYDNYLNGLDKKKKQRLHGRVGALKHGMYATAPLMCLGPQSCPFISFCPLLPRDDQGAPTYVDGEYAVGSLTNYPVGRTCVLETLFLQQRTVDYAHQLEVDPHDVVEMSIVNELAVIDLMKNRALMVLGGGDREDQGRDLLRIDETQMEFGVATTASLHPLVGHLQQLSKTHITLLDKMVSTREANIKAQARLGQVKESSRMLEMIQEIRGHLEERAGEQPDLLEIKI